MSECHHMSNGGLEVPSLTYEQRTVNECLYVITCLMVDEVPALTYEQRSVNECLYIITCLMVDMRYHF